MVKRKLSRIQAGAADGPPFVGAMLRLTWQRARQRLEDAIRAQGFADLQDRHFAIFSYPPPDGVRLSELARRNRMSRQAANYIVGQLEELGYLERRAARGSDRRLIHLTPRGWTVVRIIHDSMRALQAEWADEVGQQKFDAFMDVLKRLQPDQPVPAGRTPAGA